MDLYPVSTPIYRLGKNVKRLVVSRFMSAIPCIPITGLTIRVILLVAVAVLPAILIQGYNEYDLRESREDDIRQRVIQITKQFGEEIGELREGARQLLLALAQLSAVRDHNGTACSQLFTSLRSRFPNYALLAAADTGGRIFCASSSAASSSVHDQPFFKRALTQDGLAVGNYWADNTTHRRMIHFALQFKDKDGRKAGVVFAGLDLDWLSEHLKERGLSPTSSILIADREGNIIARLPHPGMLIGKNMRKSHEAIMDGDRAGWEEAVGVDGVTRIFGYVPAALPPGDFFLSAGQSKGEAFAAIDHATKRGVGLIAVGLLAATAAAIVGGRKFLQVPINALLNVATEWRNGNYSSRVQVRDPKSEIGNLGATFNAMADALAARYLAQMQAEKNLRELNTTLEARVEERTAQLASANRAKSMFLANMSHELRTPLNAIIGFGEMIHREIMGPIGVPTYKEYAEDIHRSGLHLLHLVDEMLDLSKVEAGKLQIEYVPAQPGALLCDSLVMLRSTAEAANVEVLVESDPSIWPVIKGDPIKLRQVFVNLIGNAIKFTPAEGKVTISGAVHAGTLEISINDTGVGMSAQDIPLVVQPFYRVSSALDSNHQGAGLGLPFAKSIVELHGGKLTIVSNLGLGTTVLITLPVIHDDADEIAEVASIEAVT
jgi:signal transduction histidine kinase